MTQLVSKRSRMCDLCKISFMGAAALQDHAATSDAHKLIFGCRVCNLGFFNLARLTEHLLDNHPSLYYEAYKTETGYAEREGQDDSIATHHCYLCKTPIFRGEVDIHLASPSHIALHQANPGPGGLLNPASFLLKNGKTRSVQHDCEVCKVSFPYSVREATHLKSAEHQKAAEEQGLGTGCTCQPRKHHLKIFSYSKHHCKGSNRRVKKKHKAGPKPQGSKIMKRGDPKVRGDPKARSVRKTRHRATLKKLRGEIGSHPAIDAAEKPAVNEDVLMPLANWSI